MKTEQTHKGNGGLPSPLLCCFRSIYPLDLSYIYRQETFSPLLSLSVFAPSRAAFHPANSRCPSSLS